MTRKGSATFTVKAFPWMCSFFKWSYCYTVYKKTRLCARDYSCCSEIPLLTRNTQQHKRHLLSWHSCLCSTFVLHSTSLAQNSSLVIEHGSQNKVSIRLTFWVIMVDHVRLSNVKRPWNASARFALVLFLSLYSSSRICPSRRCYPEHLCTECSSLFSSRSFYVWQVFALPETFFFKECRSVVVVDFLM